jgi:hypothetical protein
MNKYSYSIKSFENSNKIATILVFLFLIVILFPNTFSKYGDTYIGKTIIIVLIIAITTCNVIAGLLSVFLIFGYYAYQNGFGVKIEGVSSYPYSNNISEGFSMKSLENMKFHSPISFSDPSSSEGFTQNWVDSSSNKGGPLVNQLKDRQGMNINSKTIPVSTNPITDNINPAPISFKEAFAFNPSLVKK